MIDGTHVDVEDLLRRLDIVGGRLSSSGREIAFSCFGAEHSHGDQRPSAYINVESLLWTCHGCHLRGNVVGLVMQSQNVGRSVAEGMLRDWYGIAFDEPEGGSMVAEIESRLRPVEVMRAPIPPPRSWLSAIGLDWETDRPEPFQRYMLDRGFDPAVLADWQISYDYLSDRVIFPVFDVDGDLVGAKGRDWTDERQPRFLIVGDRPGRVSYGFEPYEASQVVFGLHRRRDVRTVAVFEGEGNAIAAAQAGVPRPVAVGMSYLSDRHAELLGREADEFVVFYDHGDAGDVGAWGRIDERGRLQPGAVQKLEPYGRVRVVDPPPDDPADLVRLGRGAEILGLIERAPPSLLKSLVFG